ncbi:MAG: hypothetical protein AAGC57_18920 [Pseudomonadota bacterium]
MRTALPRRFAWFGVLFAGLCLWAAAVTHLQTQVFGVALLDNGDGHRVLDKAFVPRGTVVYGDAPAAAYPMMPAAEALPRRLVPDSLSGLIALASALAAKLRGAQTVSLSALPFLYHLIYALGTVMMVVANRGRVLRWAAAAVAVAALASPLTLGFFGSLYEEAAVIAGMPLWTALVILTVRGERRRRWAVALALATTAMIYAKPAMLLYVVPAVAVIWAAAGPGRRRPALLLALALVCALGLARNAVRYGDYNGFNRLHNGVAYTLAEVSEWPARRFGTRLDEAAARTDAAAAERLGLPAEVVARWGQSYWPDLATIDWRERERLAVPGRLSAMIALFLGAPELLALTMREACLTALRADYRLAYLWDSRGPPPGTAAFAHFGWVLLGFAVALAVALARARWLAAVLLAPAVVAPVLVVLADGYYEYEKHLLPYLLSGVFAAIGAVALWSRAPGR